MEREIREKRKRRERFEEQRRVEGSREKEKENMWVK